HLAIGIAAALRNVHQHGLVHKEIKPANILVNGASGEVRLTGFGIASRLPRERQLPEPPEVIAGTLAYMAPEQTGRMNRASEARRSSERVPLGQHASPGRLLIPGALYVRADEIDTVLAAFERVATSGAPELVLVSGYPGIGKSSVLNQLHQVLVPPRGLFASG